MPRKTPPRARNREITVRMTPAEFETIGAAARHHREPISLYMIRQAMAIASDLKVVDGSAEQLLVHRNEKRGAYVTGD